MNPQTAKPVQPQSDAGHVERFWTLVLAGCLGVFFVLILNLVGPLQIKSTLPSGREVVRVDLSRILIDWAYYQDEEGRQINQRNPLAVQSFMWLAMFIGLGELWIRWKSLRAGRALLRTGLLPEDERALLTADDLRLIYVNARGLSRTAAFPVMVRRLAMEFRKSKSIERVNSLLDSSLELFLHQLDLRYTLIRYLVWVIPTLGFVGTMIGIANAMAFAGSGAVEMDQLLTPTTQKLAVAFYTTLLALLQSGLLVLGMNSLQSGEEKNLNDAGQYCLENLVMRLMEPGQLEAARAKR